MGTLRSFARFLILSLVFGCSTAPVATRFDAEWEFLLSPGGVKKACLAEPDMLRLREILIRCRGRGDEAP
jgi:hypothetical protein